MELEIQKEEKELQSEGPRIVAEAEAFRVIDDLSLEKAVEMGNKIKSRLDWAVQFFKPMKDAAHAAHKAICDREKSITQPYDIAKKLYIQKGADYQQKKQQAVMERERLAREAAEKKEREIKERLEKEAREKEEEARRQREIQERAEEKAREMAKKGDDQKANQALAKAAKAKEEAEANQRASESLLEQKADVYVAPRPVEQAYKPQGMSIQMVWVPEVIDEKRVPIKWWSEVDLGRLKKAKSADPTLEVPGIRFIKKAQGAALGSR